MSTFCWLDRIERLPEVSECRPGMSTAPGSGGSASRRTTTSTVLVTPLKVPADRMMTVVLSSAIGEVPLAGRVVQLGPVRGVSAAPEPFALVALDVPPLPRPPAGPFGRAAGARP